MAPTQTRRPASRPKAPTRRTSTSARRTSTPGRRSTTPARRGVAGGWIQRGRPQPKQSTFKRALGGASGALAGVAGRKAKPTPSRGKAKAGGGLAIVTAVAGLAFKNRDKLMAKAKNRGQDSSATVDMSDAQPNDANATQPVTPPRP
jgi:hypothetical protein